MKEASERRSQVKRNTNTDRKISTLPKQLPARTLPEILFNSPATSSRIWPLLTRQILNEDIHSNKDPNFLSFFEKFDIDAAYHSSEIEKTEKKKRIFELHKARLREVNEEGSVEGSDS